MSGTGPTAALELKALLTASLDRARVRLTKRVRAIKGDLARIEDAQAWAARAAWLVAAAAKTRRGAQSLTVSDWSTGEERIVLFPLDPAKSAREQVEAKFQLARRLRRGQPVAEARLQEAERELSLVDRLVADMAPLDGLEELEVLRARATGELPREMVAARPRATSGPMRGRDPEEKFAFRAFVGSGGIKILVGRGAGRNDELTFQVSRPHHWWLHAKGHTGAHVIAWVAKGKALTGEQLVDAAHLAAHFSSARGEPLVEVSYTERRYVRKPRRAPPGLVIVDRERVLVLRIEESRLAPLLKGEET